MSQAVLLSSLSLWKRLWIFTCRIGVTLFFRLGLYRRKSLAHRELFDKQYEGTPVATYNSLADLHKWVSNQQWVADGWKELWDAVCTANKVQAVGQLGDHKVGDCDEFAIYVTTAIQKSLAAGLMKSDGVWQPRFFTVMWYEVETGKTGGHNVALLQFHQPGAKGITEPTKYAYMDYGMPSKQLATIGEVADLVRSNYAGWNSTGHGTQGFVGLGWAVQDENLRVIKLGWN